MNKDILIKEEGSGGDFEVVDNDLAVVNSLKNQIYLSFFGGNIKSDVGEQNNDYWANDFFNEENRYKSDFERTILEVPLTNTGLKIIKATPESDLKHLKKYADITVSVSIKDKDLLYLYVEIKAPNNVSEKVLLIWNNNDKTWQL